MKFDKYLPTEQLRPYIRYYVVSESAVEQVYKVLPSPGLVLGFQYKGQLCRLEGLRQARSDKEQQQDPPDMVAIPLRASGVSGISDRYIVFKHTAGTGTVLVYFTPAGFVHFATPPANALFNLSLSLDDIFHRSLVRDVEETLALCTNDPERIRTVEVFLLSRLQAQPADPLVTEALHLIYQSRGTIRIQALNEQLHTSASPLEKRFRAIVGTSPKKFVSIVRFNLILEQLASAPSLTALSYEHQYFDQAHFIKDFKRYTGETPEQFKRFL